MKYLALFLAVSIATAATSRATDNARRSTIDRPDRTITWKPWHQNSQFGYRFRTGDRYLGHVMWEHYLCFGEPRFSVKTIKLFMIHLANQDCLGDVLIGPTLRYAIFKITNSNMTAHKGVWSWIAEEVDHPIQRHLAMIHPSAVAVSAAEALFGSEKINPPIPEEVKTVYKRFCAL